MRPLLLTTALAAFGVSTLMLFGPSRAAAADTPIATPLAPQIISDSSTSGNPGRLSFRDRLRSWFSRDESATPGTNYSPYTTRGYSTTPTPTTGGNSRYFSPYNGYTGPTKEPPVSIPSGGGQ
jgi:hypothetical protein